MKPKPIVTEQDIACIDWMVSADRGYGTDAGAIATKTTAEMAWSVIKGYLEKHKLIQYRKEKKDGRSDR